MFAYRDVVMEPARADNQAEKRRAERSRVSGRVTTLFRCLDGTIGGTLTVKLIDFSPHGAGFIFPESPAIGSQFLYPLRQQAGTEVYMLYTVVRAAPAADGHLVGTELTCLIPASDLKAPTVQPPEADVDPIRKAILD